MEKWQIVESKGMSLLVSNLGDIKAPAHTTNYTRVRKGKEQIFSASFKEKFLSKYITKNGYYEVALSVNGKRVKHSLHRLIGKAFVAGYSEELTINHIDGNKLNNSHENLEWVSLAKNTKLQWETGLVDLNGENHPSHKLTTKQVVYIRKLLNKGISAHTLAIISNVSPSYISKIHNGNRRKIS